MQTHTTLRSGDPLTVRRGDDPHDSVAGDGPFDEDGTGPAVPSFVLERSSSFDLDGFEQFYRSARPSIARAPALALGEADLAVDATDEALVRAYERWAKVRSLERPEGWVYRVGLNWATSVLRRRRNQQRLYLPVADHGPPVTDPAVHESLAALDIKHRSVVVCRHLLGFTVAETAEALGLREGTVKSRLHRATQQLQARLRHLDPNSGSRTSDVNNDDARGSDDV